MTDTRKFRRFVIFAEMRTGSNLLEATLNGVKGVTCFGEAFNPYMMGWPDTDTLSGISQAQRDADPAALLAALWDKPGHLPGFRYFHDHDPRIFDAVMDDPACAKIVLSRNPVDSYVSTVLARETNQWKLNETETPIPAAIRYDAEDFRETLSAMAAFQARILHRLQTSGQTAFWLGYDDLRETDVMTGLLHWLGRSDLDAVEAATDQVPQNPREMAQKVQNFAQMQADLAGLDPFLLHSIPNFEPRRGPNVPAFIGADAGAGLLFMPVRGGPGGAISAWLKGAGAVEDGFNQNALRQWKRARPGHRSFTVLRDPLARAWAAFEALLTGSNAPLRQMMREIYRVALPPDPELPGLETGQKIPLFAAFLDFLRRNVNGQTSIPVHPGWASQTEVLAGLARFGSPDFVLREAELPGALDWLSRAAGLADVPRYVPESMPDFLSDKALQKAARAAYPRDYLGFGFA